MLCFSFDLSFLGEIFHGYHWHWGTSLMSVKHSVHLKKASFTLWRRRRKTTSSTFREVVTCVSLNLGRRQGRLTTKLFLVLSLHRLLGQRFWADKVGYMIDKGGRVFLWIGRGLGVKKLVFVCGSSQNQWGQWDTAPAVTFRGIAALVLTPLLPTETAPHASSVSRKHVQGWAGKWLQWEMAGRYFCWH